MLTENSECYVKERKCLKINFICLLGVVEAQIGRAERIAPSSIEYLVSLLYLLKIIDTISDAYHVVLRTNSQN
jgi:hypothetical protein